VALNGQLARTLYVNDSDRALGILETVLAAAEHAALIPLIADSLTTKGSLLSTLGRTVEGLALLRAGQELAEANGLLSTVARALGNRANFEPQPRAAFQIALDGVAIARRLGIRRMEITAVGNGSETAVRLGEWDWVANEGSALLGAQLDLPDRISFLTAVVIPVRLYRGEPVADWFEEVERSGAVVAESEILGAVAIGHFVAGRFAEAMDTWFRQAHIDPLNAPYVMAMAARAALWSRDPARATEAIEGLEATGLHRPEVDADRVALRAGMAALEGDTADALVRYRAALATWRSLGLVWDEALCAIDMATLLDPGEPDVRAAADASRAILTRLGARPFLDRLEAAMLRDVATGAHSTMPEAATAATEAASPAPG
jgi:tetratricopeptide (TPR) repeat protein